MLVVLCKLVMKSNTDTRLELALHDGQADHLSGEEKNELVLRVQVGVHFFEKRGVKWREAVAKKGFDMGRPQNCILAHLFSSFTEGYYLMGWGYNFETKKYNFHECIFNGCFAEKREYAEPLTLLWKQAVMKMPKQY